MMIENEGGAGVAAMGKLERETFHLRDLVIHPSNPRKNADESEIMSLAQSIWANGLGEDLKGERITITETVDGVERTVPKIGIVDGGRRLRALRMIEQQSPGWADINPVPVKLLQGIREIDALVLNLQRASLTAYEEIVGYRAMIGAGLEPEDIGQRMGTSVRHVRQRLRLAWLPHEILEDLDGGHMTLDALAVYATAKTPEQALAVFHGLDEHGRGREHMVRRALSEMRMDERNPLTRFVDREEYKRRGGLLEEDLFGEGALFHDRDLAQALIAERLAQEAKAVQAEGWAWVTALASVGLPQEATMDLTQAQGSPRGLTAEEQEEFDGFGGKLWWQLQGEDRKRLEALDRLKEQIVYSAEDRAVSGVLLYVGHEGSLLRREGLIRAEDMAEARSRGVAVATRKAGVTPSRAQHGAERDPGGLSKKLKASMRSIRTAAVQSMLADDPALAFDALVFSLAGSREMRSISGIRQNEESIWTGDVIDGLDGVRENPKVTERRELSGSFAAFRTMPQEDKMALMAAAVARSFRDPSYEDRRSAFFDGFGIEIGADIRAVWTPGMENFLGAAPKARLHQIAEEIGLDTKPLREMKKQEIAETLHAIFNDPSTREAYPVAVVEAADRWRPKDEDFVAETPQAQQADHEDDDFVDVSGEPLEDTSMAAE